MLAPFHSVLLGCSCIITATRSTIEVGNFDRSWNHSLYRIRMAVGELVKAFSDFSPPTPLLPSVDGQLSNF